MRVYEIDPDTPEDWPVCAMKEAADIMIKYVPPMRPGGMGPVTDEMRVWAKARAADKLPMRYIAGALGISENQCGMMVRG